MAVQPPSTLSKLVLAGYEVRFLSHAQAILSVDFPEALMELEGVLSTLTIPIEEIIHSGGGEAQGTQRLRRGLSACGWTKRKFEIEKRINGKPRESISHEIDHVRDFLQSDGSAQAIALEIEWNNKDPFFDRDLENFKRLHAEGAISAGVVVTRGSSLQDQLPDLVARWVEENSIDSHDKLEALGVSQTVRQKREVMKRVQRNRNPLPFGVAWTSLFVSDKYATSTTHWSKLQDRVFRGVGNPCPLVLIGIPASVVTFGEDPLEVRSLLAEGNQDAEQ